VFDQQQVIDHFCAIAHDARENVRWEQENGISIHPDDPIRSIYRSAWSALSEDHKELDRAAIGAVLETFPALGLLRYLAGAYQRLLEAHERVNMDTDEDRELHGRVVSAFGKVLVELEKAMDRCGVTKLTTPRILPAHPRLVDVLEREWLAAAADKTEGTPREHCERLADAVRRASGWAD
jgi:hypothetical protein